MGVDRRRWIPFYRRMGVDRRRWICPLRGHLKGRMQYAPTLPADERHRPIKWFSIEANGRRAPPSENIPGTDERHPPIKWFSTEANGRRAPPSDVRVGAYCIRPRCSRQGTIAPNRDPPPSDLSPAGSFEGAYAIRPYPTGGWDAMTYKIDSDGGERTSSAIVGRPCRGVLHTPPMFPAGNNSAQQGPAAVGFVPCGVI